VVVRHVFLELEVDKILRIQWALFLLDNQALGVVVQVPVASQSNYSCTQEIVWEI
jgi:hypothetical protein